MAREVQRTSLAQSVANLRRTQRAVEAIFTACRCKKGGRHTPACAHARVLAEAIRDAVMAAEMGDAAGIDSAEVWIRRMAFLTQLT